jgi:hypothetical protein
LSSVYWGKTIIVGESNGLLSVSEKEKGVG